LRVVEALERLLQVAGCPDETIDLDRLTKYSAKILATADLLDSSIKPSALHVKTTERDCLASKKVLFINYLRIGKKRLVFSAFAIMAPKAIDTGTLWESESIELKELRSLPDFPGVYQEFVEKARVEIEVPCTIILDPSDEDKLVDEGFEQDAQNAAVVSPTSS
jgi:hypothetical protein